MIRIQTQLMERLEASRLPSQENPDGAPARPSSGKGPLVAGLDGREHDADALALARTLQDAFGAGLLIVHVMPPPPMVHSSGDYALAARRSARELLERAAAGSGAAVQTRLLESWPAAFALAQLAEEQRAPMIVLGSSHRGTLGSIMPGRTVSRLVPRARCPVAIAPKGYARAAAAPVGTIGMAYDGSEEADVALAAAVAAARKLSVSMRLYNAVHTLSTDPSWDLFRANMRRIAQATLDRALQQIPPELTASAVVLEGEAAEVIGQASESDGVGLLYVGSRGYGPLREAIVHGFGGGVQATARCPLVIVPPSASVESLRRSALPRPMLSEADDELLGRSGTRHWRAHWHRLGKRAL